MTPSDNKTQILLIHAGCISLIVICYVLSATLFKGVPEVGKVLTAAAALLWGKLAFKPADSVLSKVLQALEPAEVQRLSMKPPAPVAATIAPAVPIEIVHDDADKQGGASG